MKTITVNTNNAYEIYIDENILNNICYFLELNKIAKNRKILVITDKNVEKLYLNKVLVKLSKDNYICESYVIETGEEYKNLNTVENILSYLARNDYKRKDILFSLGGGVVGDIVGLCASLYMRGIDFIQIPTTLLSAVDASVGGKTAVDLPEGKNLIGTFYQPKFVICDLTVLRNLPTDIYNEGLAEIIKYGIIRDSTLLDLINDSKNNLEEIVHKSLLIKSNIVSNDEKDNDVRKILNFGHTFAHALEKCSNYTISHGKAVAEGIIFETKLSNNLDKCSTKYYENTKNIVCSIFDMNNSYSFEDIYKAMRSDKKNDSKEISFVLVSDNNETYVENVSKNSIEKTFKEIYG